MIICLYCLNSIVNGAVFLFSSSSPVSPYRRARRPGSSLATTVTVTRAVRRTNRFPGSSSAAETKPPTSENDGTKVKGLTPGARPGPVHEALLIAAQISTVAQLYCQHVAVPVLFFALEGCAGLGWFTYSNRSSAALILMLQHFY